MVRTVAALMVAGSLIAVGCEEKSAPAPAKPATPAGATTTKPAEAPKPAATEAPKPAVPAVPAAALPDLGKQAGEWTTKVETLVKSVTDAKAPAGLPAPAQKAFDEGKAAVVKAADAVKAEIAKLKDAKPEGAAGLLDGIKSKFTSLESAAKEFLAKKWDAAAPAGGK